MKLSGDCDDVIVTHGLGSCLGITVYDPQSHVGGMLHVMMPSASVNPEKAQANPFMFVDTGVPEFFHQLYAAGAVKSRLIVKVAGGANTQSHVDDHFSIGKRNYTMLKKMLWRNSVLIKAEDVGGSAARTMFMSIADGRIWLNIAGQDRDL
jgi:chemotaxis protein CheD